MSLKKNKNFIKNIYDFEQLISKSYNLKDVIIQDIDFTSKAIDWKIFNIDNTIFLGCQFKAEEAHLLWDLGALIIPKFRNIPYKPYRQKLYTWQELMKQEEDCSLDLKIYNHFLKTKFNPPVNEALAQCIHDYSIDNALREIIQSDELGMMKRKCVGFMGGHSASRNGKIYKKVAQTAKLIAESGYFVVSGGGPGIMEAANLGAYMSNRTEAELNKAIEILSDLPKNSAPEYLSPEYLNQSLKVLDFFPDGNESLALPTWFYGHEPSNLFATQVAKYFSNSIRENNLLAICMYGVVFANGSAGTTQEIFQDATQNHYGSYGYYSPMVFLGKKRYVEDTTIYSTVQQLAKGQKYRKLLYLTDTPSEACNFIISHPPIKKDE